MDVLLADDLVWDQNAFNELMYEGRVETPLREDRLFLYASMPTPTPSPAGILLKGARTCA